MRKYAVKFLIYLHIITGKLTCFFVRDELKKRKTLNANTSFFCRTGLKPLGLKPVFSGEEGLKKAGGCLVVCNHMSYLDIIIMASMRPFVFVSSVDMRETPFVGMMAELGGTYFVERRNASRLREEIKELAALMEAGFAVVLFPEGTSTDGSRVLPFRAPFIESARKAGVPVYPACLKYESVNGEPFGEKNRDLVCWYGDMAFEPHFESLFRMDSVTASVRIMDPADASHADRKELGDYLFSEVASAYYA
ncbi:1-acyl-sn-glycerol-3-phosphate acyltransferase [Geovibrio thiophilus]|uniref:1-acyl-sn-glycerol-3-phosphate acyltransferase n=1 Tax=Geovibrio thiophilus TaxID=139438 RepID=A0A410JV54_9BACT|nr:lysophospholipid acyltransferase family protein [Geovibrio thiophilus]QAR32053.1 1-acyl-sn-glycerol-3-phosphate acyltransferase [Geovibrio thiophilus]